MEKEYKVVNRLKTPAWASVVVCIIGIFLGILSVIDGVGSFRYSEVSWVYVILGIAYLGGGIAMTISGILGLVNFYRGEKNLVVCAFWEGGFYSSMSVATSLLFAILFGQVLSGHESVGLYVFAFIIVACMFLPSLILFSLAARQAKNNENPRKAAFIASVYLLVLMAISFAASFSPDMAAIKTTLSTIIGVLVLVMTIMLVVISALTANETVKIPTASRHNNSTQTTNVVGNSTQTTNVVSNSTQTVNRDENSPQTTNRYNNSTPTTNVVGNSTPTVNRYDNSTPTTKKVIRRRIIRRVVTNPDGASTSPEEAKPASQELTSSDNKE